MYNVLAQGIPDSVVSHCLATCGRHMILSGWCEQERFTAASRESWSNGMSVVRIAGGTFPLHRTYNVFDVNAVVRAPYILSGKNELPRSSFRLFVMVSQPTHGCDAYVCS